MPNITMQALSRPGNAWTGYKPAMMQYSPYEDKQRQMMNQAGQMGLQGLLSGQMPGGMSFDPMRQQAMTQFNTQTVPSLAERFTSMGGGQRSSAFQGALGQSGAGLQENLAAMQSQYQQQMLPMLMQLLGIGLNPQTEQQFLPGQAGMLENFGGQFMQGLGSAIPGFATGGGFGALASGLKGLFSGGTPAGQLQTGSNPQYFGGGVMPQMPSSVMQNRSAFNFM